VDRLQEASAVEKLDFLTKRVEEMDEKLDMLIQQRTVKDWYSTAEVAQILGKAEFTVREWCRRDRVHAVKKGSGRGQHLSWVMSHAELLRIQRDGLIPIQRTA
jgi:hypothetical protein